jgi:16S rRNA processing protein RimM
MKDEWVTVARLGRTRGLKGELYADGWDRPERFDFPLRVWLAERDSGMAQGAQPLTVASVQPYKGRQIVRFEGVDSVTAAEPLEGRAVLVPASVRPALDEGEYYMADLVGCDVVLLSTGQSVGTVSGWQEFGGPATLEVERAGTVVLIPFVRKVCVEIDPAARRIVIDPPEGLLELND